MVTEIESLQNAANNLNLGAKVHQKYFDDKRKKTNKYFLQIGNETISPVLDYEQLNYFIFGMIKYQSIINKTN